MEADEQSGRWYLEPDAAYVAGRFPQFAHLPPLERIAAAESEGIRMYRYKRKGVLPRVQRVIGLLRNLAPTHVLDVGSGRGAALWPLMDSLPQTRFTTIELSGERYAQLAAVAAGWERLHAVAGSATSLPFANDAFDAVTALEVLEHMEHPERAVAELARVSRRFVIASVPSREDDNPEHIQLFTPATLTRLLERGGCRQVKVEGVHNHFIAIGQVERA
jgi:SAM-dependent methyltransferase